MEDGTEKLQWKAPLEVPQGGCAPILMVHVLSPTSCEGHGQILCEK